ncbi:hypothetical protein THAOC_22168, partial [Thalassiosira oceanica]
MASRGSSLQALLVASPCLGEAAVVLVDAASSYGVSSSSGPPPSGSSV